VKNNLVRVQLSPLLFIIYDEVMVKEATSNSEHGVHVGGQPVNMIRYADDKAMVCNIQKGLQELMNNLNRVTKEYGMKINARNTKVMCTSNKGRTKVSIYIDGQQIEQVREFRYLGSLISDDGYCVKEIASRIGIAKKVFKKKRKLLTGKMNLELKKRIVKCLFWSVAMYAVETWT